MKTDHQLTTQNSFHEVLEASALDPAIAPEDDLYGWLIGSWTLAIVFLDAEKPIRTTGEAHFARVLEGRAVQDLFINPQRADRGPGMPEFPGNWFGTTLRIYDPSIRAWRVNWFNPRDGFNTQLIGRREGRDIVQTGKFPDGTPIRWRFVDIAADSFRWLGDRLESDGKTWHLQVEMRGTRVSD